MNKWEERRILVLGTTYPSYSRNYTETVCAGGVDEQTGRLVRIYPVPHRYLEQQHKFRAFQWIRVLTTKNESDPRPESFRVDSRSITLEEIIPSTDFQLRRRIIERCPQAFASVEALRRQNLHDGTSLGIVRPKLVREPSITDRSPAERSEWKNIERDVLSQREFWEELKPLDFPEWKFMVPWECDDPECKGHKMHLNAWGLHELARKYRYHPDGKAKVLQAMRKDLDQNNRDLYLFMGNYRTRLYNFGLMGAYSAPLQIQHSLL